MNMPRTAFLPMAVVAAGKFPCQAMLIGYLTGRYRAEFVGKQDLVRIKNRVLFISSFLHQAHQKRARSVMQRRKIHIHHNRFPRMDRTPHFFAQDFFNQCLSHRNLHFCFIFSRAASAAGRILY